MVAQSAHQVHRSIHGYVGKLTFDPHVGIMEIDGLYLAKLRFGPITDIGDNPSAARD